MLTGISCRDDTPVGYPAAMSIAERTPSLTVLTGSKVHGTNVSDQDDTDYISVVVETEQEIAGFGNAKTIQKRTQPEGVRSGPGDVDHTYFPLRHFLSLAMSGNPSILQLFYAPDFSIVHATALGESLMAQRSLIASKSAGPRFLGYMKSQHERLGLGKSRGKPRPELVEQYGFDTKYAGHLIRLGCQGVELLTYGKITLPMKDADRQLVVDVRTGKVPLERCLDAADSLERELKRLIDTPGAGVLPDEPDRHNLERWLLDTYRLVWGR